MKTHLRSLPPIKTRRRGLRPPAFAACAALCLASGARADNAAAPGRDLRTSAAIGALTLEPFHAPAPLWLPEVHTRRLEFAAPAVPVGKDNDDRRISDSFVDGCFLDMAPTRSVTEPLISPVQPETPAVPDTNADAPIDSPVPPPATVHAPVPAAPEPGTATTMNFENVGTPYPSPGLTPGSFGPSSPFDAGLPTPSVNRGWTMPAIITTARPAPVAAAAVGMVPSPAPDLHRMDAPAATTGNNLPGTASLRPLDNPASFSAAYAWGDNTYGQLGNGTNTSSTTPVQVTGLGSGVTGVAAGGLMSLAIQNGAAMAWGYNGDGELGDGTNDSSTTPVQVSGLSSGVTAVAGGSNSSYAIVGGSAKAWGDNEEGELGNGGTSNTNTPVQVTGLTSGVTAIAAGYFFTLAIQNGSAKAWGDGYYGVLGNGKTTNSSTPVRVTGLTSGVTAVAGGSAHALAIQNGAVKAWGNNGNGQLGNSAYGSSTTPVQVMGLTSGVTAIAAGQEHSLAVQGGNVYAWGGNGDGQLGNGTTDSSATSLEIDPSDLKNITAVAAASNSSYALSSDGSLWVWGDNTDGELGLGDSAASDYLTPQHLLPPSGFAYTAIDASSNGNFADAILTQVPEPATWLGGTLLGMAALGGSLPRFRRPLAVSHGFRAAEMQF